jgi:hypothetical protein
VLRKSEYTLLGEKEDADGARRSLEAAGFHPAHAIAQVLSWFAWVEDNISYALSHGYPNIHSPKGLIILGRSSELGTAQHRLLRQLNDLLYPRIRISTFDDVIANARNVLKNLTSR